MYTSCSCTCNAHASLPNTSLPLYAPAPLYGPYACAGAVSPYRPPVSTVGASRRVVVVSPTGGGGGAGGDVSSVIYRPKQAQGHTEVLRHNMSQRFFGNTAIEAASGRFVHAAVDAPLTQHTQYHDCAAARGGRAEGTATHKYAPTGANHVFTRTEGSGGPMAPDERKRVVDDVMRQMGYTVDGSTFRPPSPIRQPPQPVESSMAYSNFAYDPDNYGPPPEAASGGAPRPTARAATPKSVRYADPDTTADGDGDDDRELREKLRVVLDQSAGVSAADLRRLIGLAQGNAPLSTDDRSFLFDSATRAAPVAAEGSANPNRSVASEKYPNAVRAAEVNSGCTLQTPAAVVQRVGSHVAASDKREVKANQTRSSSAPRPSSASRGRAAGHAQRHAIREHVGARVPAQRLTIRRTAPAQPTDRLLPGTNPISQIGFRGAMGLRGASDLTLGSCLPTAAARTRSAEGRGRPASRPRDHITSLHFADGIEDRLRPSSRAMVSPQRT